MHEKLESYCRELSAIVGAPGCDAGTIVRRIEEASRGLAAEPPELGPEYRRFPKKGHGRNLVFRDSKLGFVVVAMVWPPGHEGAIHDHPSWCVLSVLEGDVDVRNYRRTDDGADPDHVLLDEIEAFHATVGDVAPVHPPPAHYHVVSNASPTEFALTLHTYGTDIEACRMVDLATGAATEVESSYDNVTV